MQFDTQFSEIVQGSSSARRVTLLESDGEPKYLQTEQLLGAPEFPEKPVCFVSPKDALLEVLWAPQ
jgi:hypothetical protein